MTSVVDASVVLKWFLPESDTAAADVLLEIFLNNEVELLAPDLLMIETASALWKRAVIRKDLTSEEAVLIYRDLRTLPLSLIDTLTLTETALRAALQYRHSIYDALYCALAIERHCEFVTADLTLVNKLQPVFPFIVHLSTIT